MADGDPTRSRAELAADYEENARKMIGSLDQSQIEGLGVQEMLPFTQVALLFALCQRVIDLTERLEKAVDGVTDEIEREKR